MALGHIGLDGVGISLDAEFLVQSAGVEVTDLFSDESFKFCDCHLIYVGYLALDPGPKRLRRERIRVQDYQLVGVDYFANCGKALHEVIKDPFMFNAGAI